MTVDLEQERLAALEKREEREAASRMHARALRVLQYRWNATPEDLRERAAEIYPRSTPEQLDELLEVVLQVQKSERKSIATTEHRGPVPTKEGRTRRFTSAPSPFEAAEPTRRRDPVPAFPHLYGSDERAPEDTMPDPAPEFPEPARRPRGRQPKEDTARIVAVLKAAMLERGGALSSPEVRALVKEKLGVELDPRRGVYYRKKGLKAAGLSAPPEELEQSTRSGEILSAEPEASTGEVPMSAGEAMRLPADPSPPKPPAAGTVCTLDESPCGRFVALRHPDGTFSVIAEVRLVDRASFLELRSLVTPLLFQEADHG